MRRICFAVILTGFALSVTAQTNIPQAPAGGGLEVQGTASEGMRRREHRPPPKAAVEACQGKTSGAVCSFSGQNGENRTGTCGAPPNDGGNHPLACHPDRRQGSKESN